MCTQLLILNSKNVINPLRGLILLNLYFKQLITECWKHAAAATDDDDSDTTHPTFTSFF